MAVFYVLLLVPVMIQHFSIGRRDINYQRKNKAALMFFLVFLTLLVMLRHRTVGTDTTNYIMHFYRFAQTEWSNLGKSPIEIGYAYFNKIITIFTQEAQVLFAVSAIVIVVMIGYTYKRINTDASLTIVLFCLMSTFVMMFSGIRQMLAIGIGFIAYEFTRQKKFVPFVLMVVLATSFHISAFMLLFMYPVFHAKITKKWLFVVVPVIAMIFIFNRQIFSSLSFVLEMFTEYDTSVTETGAYAMLILFAVFAVFSFIIPDESQLDDETMGLRNFLLLALVLQMFVPLHSIAMRMNYYYIIFIPLVIPKIIEAKSIQMSQVAVFARHVMVGFFLVYFFYNAYTGEGNLDVFPYKFFWEGM